MSSWRGWSISSSRSCSRRASKRIGERARGIAVLLFAVVALIVTIVAVAKSVNDASNAKEGENVEPTRVLEITLLPWRVERASIRPLSKDVRQALPDLASACLMYLGEGDGMLVFYDVKDGHAVRIPVSSIALKTGEFPSGCHVPD